jgi:hypothetical protein
MANAIRDKVAKMEQEMAEKGTALEPDIKSLQVVPAQNFGGQVPLTVSSLAPPCTI